MKLIVGLGNLGDEFKNTRHNVGCMVVDALCSAKLPRDVVIKSSTVYMNESGMLVKKLVDQYKLDSSNLYIVHDDLDIPLGAYKIQFGVGPKVHNGVNSIERELGTKDFWRIRFGIENRVNRSDIDGESYVLQEFTDDEKKVVKRVIKEICKKLATS